MKVSTLSLCLLWVVSASCSNSTSGGGGGGSGGAGGSAAGGGTGGTGGIGGSGGAGGGSGPLVTLSAFCGVAAIKQCDHLKTCGLLSPAQDDDCRARYEARCATKVRATDAGALAFDAVLATRCISSGYNSNCYGGPEDLYDCLDSVFEVAGRIGTPCDSTTCTDGFCPANFGSGATCRACTAHFAQGAACTQPDSCNPTVGFCPLISTDGGPVTCEPLKGPGGACLSALECAGRATCVNFLPLDGGTPKCGPIALGSPCATATDCGASAYCKRLRITAEDFTTPGTCATRIPLNGACTNEQYDDGCQGAGATCLGLKCLTAQPHSRPLSAECDAYNQCPVGAYCTCAGPLSSDGGISVRDGNCLSQQGAGGECWEEMGYSMCLPGFECTPMGKCVALRLEGQGCGADNGRCRQLLSCTQELTPGAPTCVAARAQGEVCADVTLPCAPGQYCRADAGAAQGACSPSLVKGAACANNFECQGGRCLPADGGKACVDSCL